MQREAVGLIVQTSVSTGAELCSNTEHLLCIINSYINRLLCIIKYDMPSRSGFRKWQLMASLLRLRGIKLNSGRVHLRMYCTECFYSNLSMMTEELSR